MRLFLIAWTILFIAQNATVKAASIVGWGQSNVGELDVPAGYDFIKVANGGEQHHVAIRADSSLPAWGYNSNGQAEAPSGKGYTDVAVGFASAFVDITVSDIGWVSALALADIGFDGPEGAVNTPFADLGNIFPTGLDLLGLQAFLANDAWAGPIDPSGTATGGDFDLFVTCWPALAC